MSASKMLSSPQRSQTAHGHSSDLRGLHQRSPGQEPIALAMLPAAGIALGVCPAALPHKAVFLWEKIHALSFSVVLQQGLGKVESSSA